MKKLLVLMMIFGLFVFVACGDSAQPAAEPDVVEEVPTDATEEIEEPVEEEDEEDIEEEEEDIAEIHEIVGEWAYLGTPWFRFYENGSAVNLVDGERFTWNGDGSLDAIIYESWEVNGDRLTVTWTTGVSFNYTRIASDVNASATTIEDGVDNHEIVGEWAYLGTPWFRFYENGSAVNLVDGERFTWNADGSLNAIIYESFSINGDRLTVTWTTGISFNYTRID